MKPVLYRYRDSESVIKHMDGYTPGDGWEPLYSQDQVDQLQAQLVRQQKSYEAEIKVEIDSALERAALVCDEQAKEPAWHDAPTCAGLWFCDEGDENPYRFTCHNVSIPLNPHLVGEGERWYGPIPEDKP